MLPKCNLLLVYKCYASSCRISNFVSFQVGICTSYILWALSKSFAIFILARVVGGISKGNVSLSMAIIADVSTVASRGKGMVSFT